MRPIALLVASLVATAALAASAAGGTLPPPSGAGLLAPTCEPAHVAGLGHACLRADGMFEVTFADGTVMLTHGADPHPVVAPGHGPTMGPGDPERDPACATDYYQHVLYGRPASQADRHASVASDVRSAIKRMNHVLNEEALASGGVTADYKVLCDASGEIRVDAFTVPATTTDFTAIVDAARAAGFDATNADYTIFYDARDAAACGYGTIYLDDRPGADNPNNGGGAYGVIYVDCWNDATPMHENGHNQGAVQLTAPDTDLSGHCVEGHDVMCYPTSQILVLCEDRVRFDCDNDSYFDAATEPGEWLETHWNLGSRVNRFMAFGP